MVPVGLLLGKTPLARAPVYHFYKLLQYGIPLSTVINKFRSGRHWDGSMTGHSKLRVSRRTTVALTE